MCSRADDHFGSQGWGMLGELFGPLGWDMESMRGEVRPTDQIRFVRRTVGGFEALYGRWGLVPARMTLDDAKRYATFNGGKTRFDTGGEFQDGHYAHRASRRDVCVVAGASQRRIRVAQDTKAGRSQRAVVMA